ncbi:helix-turn-helix domain-containing protein [Anaerovibrio slackiae]
MFKFIIQPTVLIKICKALECNIGDIMDLISVEEKTN